ncbi:helix-turn-helix domain-containing protein [Nonomuraea sp. bgisy101]|uniref:helix-turn-helix domain-containing protein n=1 Tax=Nonomuraea sp. bgisy101 TaxID=3413784 RepID=UPI003D70F44F
MTYVDGAVVDGFAAYCLDRILARHLPALLAHSNLSPTQRAQLESVKADIRKASRRWEASITSADVSAETTSPEITPSSEWVNTEQAATLLGMTPRRARQLAAGGLGVKVRGTWLLDRAAVIEYRQGRRTGEGGRSDGRSPGSVSAVA